ncbi:hypothetical protein [Pediococcus acidilactici]|nr:hypothetical protein [Pediococcus acidilactici]MBS9399975.1 hypothetical protein [Pediococcus acidilactici]
MTVEEIVREIYGNNYTIDNVKRIEKAVVDEQIKKEIEKDVRDQEHSN